jgi:hypothetical protein
LRVKIGKIKCYNLYRQAPRNVEERVDGDTNLGLGQWKGGTDKPIDNITFVSF